MTFRKMTKILARRLETKRATCTCICCSRSCEIGYRAPRGLWWRIDRVLTAWAPPPPEGCPALVQRVRRLWTSGAAHWR